jgi:hypothetical protein
MSNKKNIQASNLNVVNSQDGTMNSLSSLKSNTNAAKNPSSDFQQKANSAMQPGIKDTKGKK